MYMCEEDSGRPNSGPTTGYTGWWKADALVYKDAGTTLCVNNDTIQQWASQVGSNHLTQATGAWRPTFLTSQRNGLPGVKLMGASLNQFLGSVNGAYQDDPATIVFVGKFINTGGNARCLGYGSQRSIFANFNWQYYQTNGSTLDSGINATATAVCVFRLSTGVNKAFRINGVNNGTLLHADVAPAGNGLGLGAHSNDGLERGDCMFHEILHYPFSLTDAQCQQTEKYLNAATRWAVY